MKIGGRIVTGCAIVAAILLAAERGETHKPITSKYTYNEDVFPIVSARCGSCHVTGGVAPMSLLTYKDSVPWAESIRGELLAATMPPWYAELDYGQLKASHRLAPRELDILLTWATGGTPQGPVRSLPPDGIKSEWKLGKPDLVLPMPSAFTLTADKMEDSQEFVLESAAAAGGKDRWIRAADLLPGTPSIVRDAVIFTRTSGNADPNVLAVWLPGEDPTTAGNGAAFRWPAGAELAVRIHYKKTWKYEGEAVPDRSTVGIYFAERTAAREVQSLKISSGAIVIRQNLQALALRPDHGNEPAKSFRVEAVRPDGSHVPIISLTTRPGWDRRYWFAQPISLPRGTRIHVVDGTSPSLWLEYVTGNK